MILTGEVRADPTTRTVTTKDTPSRTLHIDELRVLDDTLDDFVDVQSWRKDGEQNPFADLHRGDRVRVIATKAEVYREKLRVTTNGQTFARDNDPDRESPA